MTKTKMDKAAAVRIQRAEANANGGSVSKGGFSARARAAAASNTRPTNGPSTTGNKSGGGRGNNPPKSK